MDKPENLNIEERWRVPRLAALLFVDYFNQTSDGKYNLVGIFDKYTVDPASPKTRPFGLFVRTTETRDGQILILGHSPDGLSFLQVRLEVQHMDNDPDSPTHIQLALPLDLEFKTEG